MVRTRPWSRSFVIFSPTLSAKLKLLHGVRGSVRLFCRAWGGWMNPAPAIDSSRTGFGAVARELSKTRSRPLRASQGGIRTCDGARGYRACARCTDDLPRRARGSIARRRSLTPRGFAPRTPQHARSRGPATPLRSRGLTRALVRPRRRNHYFSANSGGTAEIGLT
jgi:hypothetical protein